MTQGRGRKAAERTCESRCIQGQLARATTAAGVHTVGRRTASRRAARGSARSQPRGAAAGGQQLSETSQPRGMQPFGIAWAWQAPLPPRLLAQPQLGTWLATAGRAAGCPACSVAHARPQIGSCIAATPGCACRYIVHALVRRHAAATNAARQTERGVQPSPSEGDATAGHSRAVLSGGSVAVALPRRCERQRPQAQRSPAAAGAAAGAPNAAGDAHQPATKSEDEGSVRSDTSQTTNGVNAVGVKGENGDDFVGHSGSPCA